MPTTKEDLAQDFVRNYLYPIMAETLQKEEETKQYISIPLLQLLTDFQSLNTTEPESSQITLGDIFREVLNIPNEIFDTSVRAQLMLATIGATFHHGDVDISVETTANDQISQVNIEITS